MNDEDKKRAVAGGSLSFQDITAEIGDVQLPLREDRTEADRLDATADLPGGTVIVNEKVSLPTFEETLSTRVLTGSSPKPRPMWLDGVVSVGLGFLFLIPIVLNMGLRRYQPWISFMIMLLALGGGAWSLFGLQVEKEPVGRKWCLGVAVAGLVVAFIAFLMRAPLR